MRNDGRALEKLVEFVEQSLAQDGFDVNVNKKLFNESGTQLAEFDVVVKGKFGSTNICWLIECRNRPSAGAAPSEWIQHLAGRRALFSFNKVTAVSTTGFSPAAIEAAEKLGIELREVVSTTAADLLSWLRVHEVELVENNIRLGKLEINLDKNEVAPDLRAAVNEMFAAPDAREKMVIVNSVTGERGGVMKSFREALEMSGAFNALEAGAPAVPVEMEVTYDSPIGKLLLQTPVGDFRIKGIKYCGHIEAALTRYPIEGHAEYRGVGNLEAIAQTAHSRIPLPTGNVMTFEFKKLREKDGLHVSWNVSEEKS